MEDQHLYVLKPGMDMQKQADLQPHADDVTRKLFDEVAPSVVKIVGKADGESSAGTGFFVDQQGHIATDAHVVLGSQQLDVVTADGKLHAARLTALDDLHDLAILQIDGGTPANIKVPELKPDEKLAPDQPVWAIGHPRGADNIYISPGYHQYETNGLDILNAQSQPAVKKDAKMLDLMTPNEKEEAMASLHRNLHAEKIHVEPGNSGGPVIDKTAGIVGLADMTDDDNNTAVTPVSYLASLMNEKNPRFTFDYKFIPRKDAENKVAPDGEYILTDITRTDGTYRPPYSEPFFKGDSSKKRNG